MELLDFIKLLCEKSPGHQQVWIHIISNIDVDKKTHVPLYQVLAKSKVSKKTAYPIINFGIAHFDAIGNSFRFKLKNNIIYIFRPEDNEFAKSIPERKKRIVKEREKAPVKPNRKPTKRNRPISEPENMQFIQVLIQYLNTAAGTDHSPDNKLTVNVINSRLSEGFGKEVFYKVIDNKVAEWMNTTYEKNLKPSTLFGELFESYAMNAMTGQNQKHQKSQTQQTHESAEEAKRILAGKK